MRRPLAVITAGQALALATMQLKRKHSEFRALARSGCEQMMFFHLVALMMFSAQIACPPYFHKTSMHSTR
uniref:Secreted protein n=1 Tax=Steinernema glaseri TaxID=37863 RepID=A0A1I7ZGJ6_9BILA